MLNLEQTTIHIRKLVLATGGALLLLFALSAAAVFVGRPQPPGSWLSDAALPILLGVLPSAATLWVAWRIAGRFVYALYGLRNEGEGRGYLSTRLFGKMGGGPYLVVKEGQVPPFPNVIKHTGGPGAVVLYNDSAIVLEQYGRLTRVKRGSGVVTLEPFEKVWATLSILPQRWEFPVEAITQDGIPITYPADIHFQIGDTDEDIFKAATCTWIRDADRPEPERLMTWDKRVIIGDTEGILRAIVAQHTLDQLIDAQTRQDVRQELETRLRDSVPNLGAKILLVQLGDIKLQDQILQQWFESWQAEHDSQITIAWAEALTEGARLTETVRQDIGIYRMDHTASIIEEMEKRGVPSLRFVLLSLVERIERLHYERKYMLPDNLIGTLAALHGALYPISSGGSATSATTPPPPGPGTP